MVALQIRDVEPEVRDVLVRRAGEKGQSLQGFLLELVRAEARRSRNAEALRRFEGRSDGASDGEVSAADIIRREREERMARFGLQGETEGG